VYFKEESFGYNSPWLCEETLINYVLLDNANCPYNGPNNTFYRGNAKDAILYGTIAQA
jgi:hypothetical protein